MAGGTSWWYEFHCWSCQWTGTARNMTEAKLKHGAQSPSCSKSEIIQAPEPIPEWLANPSAEDLAKWGI